MAGSGIKGVFRNHFQVKLKQKEKIEEKTKEIFGYEDSTPKASTVSFTAAKILFYPVRSLIDTSVWITCPLVLQRLIEEIKNLYSKSSEIFSNITSKDLPIPKQDNEAFINNESLQINRNEIAIEEFIFNTEKKEEIKEIAEEIKKILPRTKIIKQIPKKFVLVSNNVFTDLLNKDSNTKNDIMEVFEKEEKKSSKRIQNASSIWLLQFGRDETIGIGFTLIRFSLI